MNKNKNHKRFNKAFVGLLCLILLMACESPKLFEAPAETQQDNHIFGPEGSELMWVHVAGGYAGVNETLSLWQNGFSLLEDYFGAATRKVMLEEAEVNRIIDVFVKNDFFRLEDEYLSEQRIADAFQYEIRFDYGGVNNTVVTDGFAGPETLKNILTEIHDLITTIVQATPNMELSVNETQQVPADTLNMRLTVSNALPHTLVLHFSDAQIYDFTVRDNSAEQNDSKVIWNWAHDKFFAEVATDLTLQPNEVRIYEEKWDGRDNNGNIVQGNFFLGAQLKSLPGGSTEEMTFMISHPPLVTRSVVTYGDSLRITISVSDSVYTVEQEVEIIMEAENISDRLLSLQVGEESDMVEIRRADDNQIIWNPRTFDANYRADTITAGAKVDRNVIWDKAMECTLSSITGDYLIQGHILGKPTGVLRIRIIN